ncbi:hypothetical protein [Candidatus Halocynthiibacter alkanivorans]|uniref:hypothetical protein n=1 Tax=Candidatus Halocynthiibacter alkanivorans TaxID=2267619 RepID=UPI00109C671F|nr:hypothetical protein [Candidatus Halocynthiibacter alkanivorans]
MKTLLKVALLLPALFVPLPVLAAADVRANAAADTRADAAAEPALDLSAGARASLADSIVEAVALSTGNRRSGARIEGCEVTTWVESDEGGLGWLLYSQSVFDLAQVDVVAQSTGGDTRAAQYYIFGAGMGIISLRATAPYKIAQEVADFGVQPEGARTSKRVPEAAGGPGYYFTQTKELMLVLDGIEDAAQPRRFAEGLRTYKDAFCPPA